MGEVEVVEESDFEEGFERKVIRIAHLGPETQDSENHPDSPSRPKIVEHIAD